MTAVSTDAPSASGSQRTDLQQHDLSARTRGRPEPRQHQPEAPALKHKHPGEEIIYVLEGSLEYQIEGRPPPTVNAGEVFFVPAETVHAVRNRAG
jgi:quercetin dioxygenase-like cupin family protein